MKIEEINKIAKLVNQNRVTNSPYTYPFFVGMLNKNQLAHKLLSNIEYLDELNKYYNLRELGNNWIPIDPKKAKTLSLYIYRYSLAYNHELRTETKAKKITSLIFKSISSDSKFYTNINIENWKPNFNLKGSYEFEHLDENVFCACLGIVSENQILNIVAFDND